MAMIFIGLLTKRTSLLNFNTALGSCNIEAATAIVPELAQQSSAAFSNYVLQYSTIICRLQENVNKISTFELFYYCVRLGLIIVL